MVPMKRIWKTTAAAALVCVLAACSAAPSATVADASDIQSAQSSSAQTDTGFTGTTSTEITAGETTNTETTGDTTTETTSTATASGATPASGVAAVLAENDGTHDDAGDYIWDSATAVAITFDGEGATVDGEGAMVEGSTVTITRAGTYSLSGTLRDGQVVVDTADEEDVRLVLNGVALANSTSAPINVVNADDVVLILAAGTENTVSDATTYVFATAEEAPNAAIYSAADLSIGGEGTLLVQGNHNDAIASQDGLVIASGTITVNAVDDGIRGKDYLVVRGGTITVEAGGDGLKSDNAEDAANGYVLVEGGTLDITAGGDAVDAETDALIANGTLTITAGGGSSGTVAADASAKGIKGTANVVVDGGTLTIDTADDAVHSNGNVVVNGGTLTLRSGDDAMHGDATVTINAGEITVAESYEGIESGVITINDGTIHVTASDDAVNVAGGVDGSGLNRRGGMGGGDASTYMGEFFLRINGGTLVVIGRQRRDRDDRRSGAGERSHREHERRAGLRWRLRDHRRHVRGGGQRGHGTNGGCVVGTERPADQLHRDTGGGHAGPHRRRRGSRCRDVRAHQGLPIAVVLLAPPRGRSDLHHLHWRQRDRHLHRRLLPGCQR
jgi:hypothetical protein